MRFVLRVALLSSAAFALHLPAVQRPSLNSRCAPPAMAAPPEEPEQAQVTQNGEAKQVQRKPDPALRSRVVPTNPQHLAKADSAVLVQGNSLRTWSFRSAVPDHVQIVLSSEGRPIEADVELWQGPGNVPCKLAVYVQDGRARPFSAVLATPSTVPSTVAIRNTAQLEFPFNADVFTEYADLPSDDCVSHSEVIQGGALRTYPFDPTVESVEVYLRTDGRPLKARVEIMQGPNNNKQVIELYAEDGAQRPLFAILETPGAGNVLRIVNTAPMEFPMAASVVPHSISDGSADEQYGGPDVVLGGGDFWGV